MHMLEPGVDDSKFTGPGTGDFCVFVLFSFSFWRNAESLETVAWERMGNEEMQE